MSVLQPRPMWIFVTLEWTSISWAGSLTPSPLPPPNHHPTITELRWTSDIQKALALVQSGNSRPKVLSCLCFSAWETGPRDHHTEWSQSDRESALVSALHIAQTSSISRNTCSTELLFSCSIMSDSLQPHGLQNARLLCPSLSPRVCSDSCPLSWWCYLTISSSVAPFSSCLQSFPASLA